MRNIAKSAALAATLAFFAGSASAHTIYSGSGFSGSSFVVPASFSSSTTSYPFTGSTFSNGFANSAGYQYIGDITPYTTPGYILPSNFSTISPSSFGTSNFGSIVPSSFNSFVSPTVSSFVPYSFNSFISPTVSSIVPSSFNSFGTSSVGNIVPASFSSQSFVPTFSSGFSTGFSSPFVGPASFSNFYGSCGGSSFCSY